MRSLQVRCPSESMPKVTEMVGTLSPLARLDEMHPSLAKFSVPAAGELGDRPPARTGAGEGVTGEVAMMGGLSLSKAFETIESRKTELRVWDYSISQATLESIFMSFAKHQEEEVASVPGVQYTDTDAGDVDAGEQHHGLSAGGNNHSGDGDGDGDGGGGVRQGRSRPPQLMDVEMGRLGGGKCHSRERDSSHEEVVRVEEEFRSGEGENAALLA
ncbi:unnamed protein product [Ectocarpus sp. CCAP 1310/34]|nr:unnamed protein product [Ectocarpus sp. CCAP 1310/34]